MQGGKPKPCLAVDVPNRADDSFKASDTTFTHGDLHIDRRGVFRDHALDPEPSPSSANGTLISDFEELEFLGTLGSGSTSIVHSARHRSSGQALAVKEIKVFEKEQRRSLLKELHTLYETDSGFLVNFYGAFYKEGSIYIVLELMELGSLQDMLTAASQQSLRLPEFVLAALAKQVLHAFDYLHTQKHMVHRDIKPTNIVLSRDGHAKLTDFGVSTELGESAVATTFVGTQNYMSPERIMGNDYSYPSDIWSLGVTLLECALGRYPYPTGSIIEMMQLIVSGDTPVLPVASTSESFRAFIGQCLRKDPNSRPSAVALLNHSFVASVTPEAVDRASQWIVNAMRQPT